MPELLGQGQGAVTSAGYTPACTLGPATGVRQLFFQVLDADAIVQYWKYQPGNADAQPVLELLERTITQGSLVTVPSAGGARWRDAVAGQHATILAEIDFQTDLQPAFQQVSQVTLTLGMLHDGTLVGSETAIDFVDSSSVTFALTDVPGTKVTVTATAIGAPPTGAASGDLGGSYPGPTVTGLQGRALASTAPSTNQVIAWSGSQWTPATQLVTSVFGRTGAVVATSGDYSVGQVTGAAPLASPALTGTPTSTTPATADNSTKIATTAYVQAQGYVTAATAPVTSVDGRTGAVTGLADLTSASAQVFTGNVAAGSNTALPTASTGSVIGTTGAVALNVATATTNAIAVGVANNADTLARWVARPDRQEWGPGSAARDTFLTRVLNTGVLGNTSGTETGLQVSATSGGFMLHAGMFLGAVDSGAVGSGSTVTPDLAQGVMFSVAVNTAGATTLTIANPVNRPAAGATTFLIVLIANGGASGGTTVSWGTAFDAAGGVALPTSVTFGTNRCVVFVWDNRTQNRWLPIVSTTG